MLKNQAGGRARLRCTLVDTDQRRVMYQTPFLGGDLAEDVGDEEGGSEQGSGCSSLDEPRAMVQRLQSTTEGLTPAELRQKALMTGAGGGRAGCAGGGQRGVWMVASGLGVAAVHVAACATGLWPVCTMQPGLAWLP